MKLSCILLALFALGLGTCSAQCDSEAARAKLRDRFTDGQLEDMRMNGHYKYMGHVLFYAASFEVKDGTGYRAPTEEEIAAIDLHAHDGLRSAEEAVEVMDEQLQQVVRLLSRQAFEQLVMERYSDADRAAYLAYKASLQQSGAKRQ